MGCGLLYGLWGVVCCGVWGVGCEVWGYGVWVVVWVVGCSFGIVDLAESKYRQERKPIEGPVGGEGCP